uniref:Uncharacterized protein n=1 Tax=Globodera rostochiensis TaxID=31243 RepID=A0A914I9N3_GLORO
MRRKTKEQREAPSKTAAENCKATPKSPLMSVAHSVKTRLTRLTALKQAKDALPMSRSLEIGRQQSRIPTVCGDPMTKSWSLETTTPNMNSSEMPRRGPMTTLLPSPRGVPRRLPPGEETDDHSTGKQVQFAPLPVLSSTTELRRVPEMEFTELTFEEREKERPRGNRTKMTVIEAEATLSTVPPPLPKSSPPQLWPSLSTPKTLRKSPQSFPPMGAHSAPISFADDVPPVRVRAAKSALSVSFGAVEGGGPIRDRKAQHGAPEARGGKRRVFCSRSLRLVATRVCEASPLLVRRRRGRSAGRDGTGDRETAKTTRTTDQQKEASSSSSYTGLFRKRHSVPAEQKAKSKSFSESASITSAGAATTGVRLRSVRSHRRVAPLAESESSRVADENSPAVEQCGAVPWKMGIKMTERRGFFGGKIKNGRANVGSATNTTAPKEGQKSKSFAAALYPPPPTFRPTLAQLLASPQPRKKSPGDNTGPKARSGLIDDEIGDQPMLISASPPAVLSTDFRLIDELSSGPSPAVTQTQSNNANKMSPSSPADSSDAPSSVVLVAEQWAGGGDPRGEILLVQSRLESALKIGGRKRNARSRSDPKGAKVNGNAAGAAAAPCHASTSEVTAKRPPPPAHPTELPKDVKSEDGAAVFFPVLLSDFRSDLHQLQDSLRRDLEELETLRLQNAVLRQQLAERDRIIASLQQQLRGQNG